VACVVLPSLFVVLSTFLLALARLFRINRTVVKFSYIYVSVVHIALIGMLGSIVNTVLLLIFKSPQDIQRELDMAMIPGLHHLAGFLKNETLLELLSIINPVSLWEMAIVTIAIRVLAAIDRTRALVFAAVLWLPPTLFAAVF